MGMLMATVVTASDADRAEGYETPQLAYNLSTTRDWEPGMQFLNLLETARSWSGRLDGKFGGYTTEMLRENGYLNSDGWLTGIPEELNSVDLTWSWRSSDAVGYRAGTYVLRYEGDGTLQFKGTGINVLSEEDGKIVIETTGDGFFELQILETDPHGTGDYIRNISLVREENVDLYDAGAMFNPQWLELIKDAGQIRFMDWMGTNNSQVVTWEDRPVPGGKTSADVPLEYMVRLANEVGADPWFTIPHLADENYIRNFATYVRDNLDPDLSARIEYTNEAWNWAFGQTKWMLAKSKEEWGVDNGWNDYYVKKAVEVALIFEEVFEETGDEHRLINVLGTQAVNAGLSERLLSADIWKQMEPENWVDPTTVFEELSVTTYFGDATVSKPELRQELLEAIENPDVDAAQYLYDKLMDPSYQSSIPSYAQRWAAQAEVAEKAGLTLSAYEGGQHVHHTFAVGNLTDGQIARLTDFMQDFVRSEHMAKLYEAAWDAWVALTDSPFMQFGDVDDSSWRASFGLRTGLDDDNPVAVTLEKLAAEAAEASGTGSATAYQHGVIVQGSDEAEVLTGTREEDYLVGKGGDDVFVPGMGDDGIHGGAGHDRVILSGSPDAYTLEVEGKGYRLTGPEGSDFLIEVEALSFETGELLSMEEMLNWPAPAPVPDEATPPEESDVEQGGNTPPADPVPEEPDVEQGEATPPADPVPGVPDEGSPDVPAEPEDAVGPEVGETVTARFTGAGEVVHGADVVFAEGATGITVSAMNRYAAAGRELGLDGASTAYVINRTGITVEIGGEQVSANYHSLHEDKATSGGAALTGNALQTALQLGSIYTGVATIVGTESKDAFYGRDHADSFDGGAGNDYMAGGAGDDLLRGGAGNDMLVGGAGEDTALFSGTADAYLLTHVGGVNYRISGLDGNDQLVEIERLRFDDGSSLSVQEMLEASLAKTAQGNGTNRQIATSEGAVDVVYADTAGAIGDVVDAGGGTLRVTGDIGVQISAVNPYTTLGKQLGEGADRGFILHEVGKTADFGEGEVTADYWSMQENRTAASTAPLSSTALETMLKLGSVALNTTAVVGGMGNDRFYGSAGSDNFDGGGGNDVLSGGKGDDTLAGGQSNDQLIGGEGRDLFLFAKGDGIDVIRDFSREDTLDLGNFLAETHSANPFDHLSEGNNRLILDNGDDAIHFIGLTLDDASWVFG